MTISVRYQHVPREDFGAHAHIVWEGLHRVGVRHVDTISLSDVEESVNQGSIILMAVYVEKMLSGFSTFSLSTADDGVLTLYGQVGYIRPDIKMCLADEGFRAALVMCRRFGANRLQFSSARKGWVKKAKKAGFSIAKTEEGLVFSKDIT